jgi:hypothetical protein
MGNAHSSPSPASGSAAPKLLNAQSARVWNVVMLNNLKPCPAENMNQTGPHGVEAGQRGSCCSFPCQGKLPDLASLSESFCTGYAP